MIMMRLLKLAALIACLASSPLRLAVAQVAPPIELDSPERLLERAAIDKNHLRDVINEIDLYHSQLRDQAAFDRYFFILDDLQAIAVRLDLDSIYPNAVKSLGNRMVLKGVNWLDIMATPLDRLLYYHRWMNDPQTASSFMFLAELQIKAEADPTRLRTAAVNLEALMAYAAQKWPLERGLNLLYRNTISNLASRALKNPAQADADAEFWLGKVYTSDAMSEYATFLQNSVYGLSPDTAPQIHWLVARLSLIYAHVRDPAFGATEGLIGQMGDTAVDLILKSFRLERQLTDDEFDRLLAMMQTRHYTALATAWTSFGKVPRGAFAGYYLSRAYRFVQALREKGMTVDAIALSESISRRSAAIQGHQYDIEGTWTMRDARGRNYRLVMAYASEETIFASFGDAEQRDIRPLFNFIYDDRTGGFIAAERNSDLERSPNRPIRIIPQQDGSMQIIDINEPLKPPMAAHRTQRFPDLLAEGSADAPSMDGVYSGSMQIPTGKTTKAQLAITVLQASSIGNLQMLEGNYNSTLNFGSPANNGVVYLTKSNVIGSGTWMQIRAKLGADGYLRGYAIYGGSGAVDYQFALKKVR